jgi:hypothetical protein
MKIPMFKRIEIIAMFKRYERIPMFSILSCKKEWFAKTLTNARTNTRTNASLIVATHGHMKE